MDGIFKSIIKNRTWIVALILILTIIFGYCFTKVGINYDITDYLPEDVNSTVALDLLEDEFDESVPNCDVMVQDVSIEEALDIKERLEDLDGVDKVTWLDDFVDIKTPLEVMDQDQVEDYYKDGYALFSVTVADGKAQKVTERITEMLGEDALMRGSAVNMAEIQNLSSIEISRVFAIIIPLFLVMLLLSTTSWLEPFLYLLTIGIAIVINLGTEIFRGEISFVTKTISPILQMAVSLDYAVFLSASYQKYSESERNRERAMLLTLKESGTAILASALTTIFAFYALTFMDFDLGADAGVSLMKGVCISLLVCMAFLPSMILLLDKPIRRTRHRRILPSFHGIGKGLTKIRVPAFVIVVVLSMFGYLGQKQNEFTYSSSPEGTQAAADRIEEIFGERNTMVVLVPRGERAKEDALCDSINKMDYVTDVLSYTESAGTQIPPEYLSQDVQEEFYSDHYARIIVYSSLPDECDESFTLVKDIRKKGKELYGADVYTCGQSGNLYDMSITVHRDNKVVNVITLIALYLVLLITMHSWIMPLPLMLSIKVAVWFNMSVPYWMGENLSYAGYLIVSTIQMGATVDYAILVAEHYRVNRRKWSAREAMERTLGETVQSIIVSVLVLTLAGFALGIVSSTEMIADIGMLVCRGALISFAVVLLFLPALLVFMDKLIYRKKDVPAAVDDRTEMGGFRQEEVSGVLGVPTADRQDGYDDSDIWTDGGMKE